MSENVKDQKDKSFRKIITFVMLGEILAQFLTIMLLILFSMDVGPQRGGISFALIYAFPVFFAAIWCVQIVGLVKIYKSPTKASTSVSQDPSLPQPAGKKYCSACGAEINAVQKFCDKCGARQ